MKPIDLMVEYIEAFKAANTMSDPPHIYYGGGWYTIKSPALPPRRYRRKQIEAMRDRLRDRAALASA